MEVEVTPSVLGSLVPSFLLKFEGDADLQNYFRRVLKTNYHKGIVNLDFGHCQMCCSLLSFKDRPRMKPSSVMTKKIHKLLARSTARSLGKYSRNLVQKYLKSSTQLIVKCPSCSFINRRPVTTNETKLQIKDRLLKSCLPVPEPTPAVTKKKKKKKRKRKQNDDNSGLLIPDHEHTQNETILSQDDSVYSPLVSGSFSTPLSAPGRVSTPLVSMSKTSQDLRNSVLGKTSKVGQTSFKKSSLKEFMTPVKGRQQGQQFTAQHHKQRADSQAKRGKLKHKQLKEFLSHDSPVQKTASLADFLSSL